jgi:hypothetical protein
MALASVGSIETIAPGRPAEPPSPPVEPSITCAKPVSGNKPINAAIKTFLHLVMALSPLECCNGTS